MYARHIFTIERFRTELNEATNLKDVYRIEQVLAQLSV